MREGHHDALGAHLDEGLGALAERARRVDHVVHDDAVLCVLVCVRVSRVCVCARARVFAVPITPSTMKMRMKGARRREEAGGGLGRAGSELALPSISPTTMRRRGQEKHRP